MIEAADQLYEKIIAYDPTIDGSRLRRAFIFGMEAHEGQVRASGEPYFTHPISVANLLADMKLDLDKLLLNIKDVNQVLHDELCLFVRNNKAFIKKYKFIVHLINDSQDNYRNLKMESNSLNE